MAGQATATFSTDSLRFSYPANWTREVEETDEGLGVTLQSPGVSFAIVGIYEEDQDPDDLVEQAVDSLRDEHPSLEVEEIFENDNSEGMFVEALFMSLDTVSYCWIRSWQAHGHCLLAYMQSVEKESEAARKVFQAICRSVKPLETAEA